MKEGMEGKNLPGGERVYRILDVLLEGMNGMHKCIRIEVWIVDHAVQTVECYLHFLFHEVVQRNSLLYDSE